MATIDADLNVNNNVDNEVSINVKAGSFTGGSVVVREWFGNHAVMSVAPKKII